MRFKKLFDGFSKEQLIQFYLSLPKQKRRTIDGYIMVMKSSEYYAWKDYLMQKKQLTEYLNANYEYIERFKKNGMNERDC